MKRNKVTRKRINIPPLKNAVAATLMAITICLCTSVTFAAITGTDSAAPVVAPNAKNANAILTLISGIVTLPATSFTTPACPTGFNPFVTISSGKTKSTNVTNLTTDTTVCINDIIAGSTSNTVNFSQNAKYVQGFSNLSHPDLWISNDKGASVKDVTNEPMPDTTFISTYKNTDTTMVGNIQWVLYCYPAGMAVPSYPACP